MTMDALGEKTIESFNEARRRIATPPVPNVVEAIADAFEPQTKSLESLAQEAKRQADALEEQVRQAKLDAADAKREAKSAAVRAWIAIVISLISAAVPVATALLQRIK